MKLKIKDIIGARCIIKEDGQRLYDSIYPKIKKGETVVLDFDGVSQFASPFFNFAIGQLLKEFKKEDIEKLLKVENIREIGHQIIARVIENAAQYHANPNYKKIVDDILKQEDLGTE